MANNFGDDPVHAEPDPNFKHDDFVKSERERKINELSEKVESLPEGDERMAARRELLQSIEGEEFFSTEEGIKIILLNGPPRCGKDTAAEFALNHLGKRGERYRFAAPLKNGVHSLFGYNGVHEEAFNPVKDIPSDIFYGMTPRQAYIWMSEEVVKPKFGHDFFARVAVATIGRMKKPVIVISDCGFVEEAAILAEKFGNENVAIVHLYRDGTDFSKDSRSYVSVVGCPHFNIENNGDVHHLYERVTAIIDEMTNAK